MNVGIPSTDFQAWQTHFSNHLTILTPPCLVVAPFDRRTPSRLFRHSRKCWLCTKQLHLHCWTHKYRLNCRLKIWNFDRNPRLPLGRLSFQIDSSIDSMVAEDVGNPSFCFDDLENLSNSGSARDDFKVFMNFTKFCVSRGFFLDAELMSIAEEEESRGSITLDLC